MAREVHDPTGDAAAARERLIAVLLHQEGLSAAADGESPPDVDSHALLASERQLWFLSELEPESAAYNVGFAYRLPLALDWKALRHSLDSAIERHPSLRTTFDEIDGAPRRRVAPRLSVEPLVVDLGGLPPHLRTVEMDRALAGMTWRPYRPAQRVWRAAVIDSGDRHPVLVLGFHHLLVDGWSIGVLMRDIGAAYVAARQGARLSLSPVGATPAELAMRQREWLNSPQLPRHLAYWRELLVPPHDPPRIPMAFCRRRQTSRPPSAGVQSMRLDESLVGRLRTSCRDEGTTTVNVLLAALAIQLWRYTGQDDIRIGTVAANRAMAGVENTVAFLANTLLLRVAMSAELTARDVIERVHRASLESWSHQQCPFDRVAQEIDPRRDLTADPLFSVMFVHYTADLERLEWEGGEAARVAIAPRHAKFDVTLTAVESADSIELRCEYRRDLLTASAVAEVVAQYAAVLEAVVAAPETRVVGVGLGGAAWAAGERRVEAPATGWLPEVVAARAAEQPDAVAVVSDGAQVTYAGVMARAAGVAAVLTAAGVGAEARVGVVAAPGVALLVGLVGVLGAGAAYVPLDPAWPAARLEGVLRDCGARVVVGDAAGAAAAGGRRYVDVETVEPVPRPWRWRAGWPDQAAYVLYTSGSTGTPKGVVVTHANVQQLLAAASGLGGPAGVWTLGHAATFDFSVWEMWGAWAAGARLVVVPYWTRRDPAALWRLLVEEQVTVFNQTPSAWRAWLSSAERWGRPRALAWVLFGGEALGVETVAPWWRLAGEATQLVNLYGITETTVHVTWRRLTPADAAGAARQPIGTPLPPLDLYVWDAAQQPTAEGVIGELWVGGAGVARGYWRAPGLTADRFRPHPHRVGERVYRSGDLARRLPGDEVDYLGRADQQVKVRGVRIERGEVEAALAACPGVGAAVVVVRANAQGAGELVAYVVPGARPAPTPAALRAALRQQLPDALLPAHIVCLDHLPLTPNGKLDVRALPPPDPTLESADVYARPRTAFEEAVAEVWCDTLGREVISRDQDFFDAGGSSLQATMITARLRKLFGIALSVRTVFDAPTIAALAHHIQLTRGHSHEQPRILPRARSAGPLTFAQSRLWIAEKLAGVAPVFVVSGAFRLHGPIDSAVLDRALKEVIARHASLRTGFGGRDGKPEQRVLDSPSWCLTITDLTGIPEPLQPVELARRRNIQANRPFDLSRPPLFRVQLVRFGPFDAVLIWSVHHLVFDGWSRRILWEEVSAIYAAHMAGGTPHLAALPIQPIDVAWWERENASAKRESETRTYWADRLKGRTARLRLGPPPSSERDADYRAAVVSAVIPEQVMQATLAFGRAEGSTLFMTMYAAFAALLFRYTGIQDTIVGTPISNRASGEADALIGFFVNMLVLRTRLNPAIGFRDLVTAARQTCLGAYEHADAILERVPGAAVAGATSGSHARLVDVVFTLTDDESRTALHVADVSVIELEPIATAGEDDLSLLVKRSGGFAEAVLLFRTSLFDRASMRELVDNYSTILAAGTAEPERPISELHLASLASAANHG